MEYGNSEGNSTVSGKGLNIFLALDAFPIPDSFLLLSCHHTITGRLNRYKFPSINSWKAGAKASMAITTTIMNTITKL